MGHYRSAWRQLPNWEVPDNFQPNTLISIIIPARDEAENIEACLQSILAQNYPTNLFEVIVLDDHSTDATPELVRNIGNQRVRLIQLADVIQANETQSFKKKALEVGINAAKGNLIVTTDADCLVQPNWLALIASFYEEKQYQFIAAPVNFYDEQSTFERFQSLDFMGMMGIAGAGVQSQWMRMCNGANLAYEKSLFQSVGGFDGIVELASGDDMLLMQKIAQRSPEKIGYLKSKSATTFTKAKPTLSSFIQQRLRWATKSNSYPEVWMTVALAIVFLFCCQIPLSFLLGMVWHSELLIVGIILLVGKAIADYFLLSEMATFFQRRDLMRSFVPSFFLHLLYIIGIGTAANLKKEYTWKGRKVQ
jgi:cellulose synthase/poly-beta-1,6-N-acetylglucosamine synthase-like glycosyltransferase